MRLIIIDILAATAIAMGGAAVIAAPRSTDNVAESALAVRTDTVESRIGLARYARTRHAVADELKTFWAQAGTASRRLISVNARNRAQARAEFQKAERALSASWTRGYAAKT